MKNITSFLLLAILASCSESKSTTENTSEDSLSTATVDSTTSSELDEFNNTDNGAPGIDDMWKADPDPVERAFLESLKKYSSGNLFALDSIPYIKPGEGVYSETVWLKAPDDLLMSDALILLVNPNSDFSNNALRINTWPFDSECALEEFPDGIYTNNIGTSKSQFYSGEQAEDKSYDNIKKWLSTINENQLMTFYIKWTSQQDDVYIIKLHTAKVNGNLKLFAISDFICGG